MHHQIYRIMICTHKNTQLSIYPTTRTTTYLTKTRQLINSAFTTTILMIFVFFFIIMFMILISFLHLSSTTKSILFAFKRKTMFEFSAREL